MRWSSCWRLRSEWCGPTGQGGSLPDLRQQAQELQSRFADHDALNATPEAEETRELAGQLRLYVRAADAVLLPRLSELPDDELVRLGEDMRQVMG